MSSRKETFTKSFIQEHFQIRRALLIRYTQIRLGGFSERMYDNVCLTKIYIFFVGDDYDLNNLIAWL